jgi:hypothetical protein
MASWPVGISGAVLLVLRFTPRYALEKNETRACLVQVVLELELELELELVYETWDW